MKKKVYLVPEISMVAIALNAAIMSPVMPGDGKQPEDFNLSPMRKISSAYV